MENLSPDIPTNERWENGTFCPSRGFILDFVGVKCVGCDFVGVKCVSVIYPSMKPKERFSIIRSPRLSCNNSPGSFKGDFSDFSGCSILFSPRLQSLYLEQNKCIGQFRTPLLPPSGDVGLLFHFIVSKILDAKLIPLYLQV